MFHCLALDTFSFSAQTSFSRPTKLTLWKQLPSFRNTDNSSPSLQKMSYQKAPDDAGPPLTPGTENMVMVPLTPVSDTDKTLGSHNNHTTNHCITNSSHPVHSEPTEAARLLVQEDGVQLVYIENSGTRYMTIIWEYKRVSFSQSKSDYLRRKHYWLPEDMPVCVN